MTLGLSNEPLFVKIGQGAAKLRPVKIVGSKKLPYFSIVYLVKWGSSWSRVEYFFDFKL